MHTNSLLLFNKYAASLFAPGAKVLEIGPDGFPSTYRRAIGVSCEWHTIGLKEDGRLTYRASGEYDYPVEADSYDIVLSGNVIEHVRKPWRWMPELVRLAKPGGLVITINPVSWTYHEAPVDCWRIYPEGMRALCEESGLRLLVCQFESLETPHFKRFSPGVSAEYQAPRKRFFFRLFGPLGFPVERAYDTITIAQK